jgi:hypothetical protein
MFHLFAILDMSDGEIARYRKEGGMEGHYLDWVMGFVSSSSLMLGLFISSYEKLIISEIYIYIGVLAVLVPTFDKVIMTSGWTTIIWTILRNRKNQNNKPLDLLYKDISMKPQSKIFRRIKFIFNHIFMDHWAPLTLLSLSILDYFLNVFSIVFIDYKFYVLMYIGVFGTLHVIYNTKNLIYSNRLRAAYNRVFYSSRDPEFPQDDFL